MKTLVMKTALAALMISTVVASQALTTSAHAEDVESQLAKIVISNPSPRTIGDFVCYEQNRLKSDNQPTWIPDDTGMTLVIKDLDPTTSLMVVEHICDGWLKAVVNMVHPTPVKRFTVQVQASTPATCTHSE